MAGLTGYFGGKNAMSSWIYSNIPKDIKTYVEVFGGSFAIYFNEDFSHCERIIYNDANKWQSNFMASCIDYNKMVSKIEESFKSGFLHCDESILDRKKFYRDLYTKTKNPKISDYYDNSNFTIPDYDNSVIYSFMITSAFNACHARGAGFSGFSKNNKLKITTLLNKLNNKEYQLKLSKISEIENLDFEDIILKYNDKNTYLYLDPPYRYTDGVGTHDQDYGSKNIFGDSSHERLSNILKSSVCRWSLSYYWFEDLEKWYPRDKYHWISRDFNRSSASFSNKTKGTELLIMNYDPKTGIKIND